jgi:pimeloyl-ACP methyl ester carboxylesterase
MPRPARAAPYQPSRFSVRVRGTGPDVILIPGLTASRDVWRGTVAGIPGYRYHLVQVAGFAGEPARGNARGPIISSVAEELSRYIVAGGLRRPAIVGHSMGGAVAILLAARHPSQAGKLMVVDMLPKPAAMFGSSPEGVRGLADSLAEMAAAPGGRELVASFMGMFGDSKTTGPASDPDVVARSLHELATMDLTPQLPRIGAPFTVLYAVADPRRRAEVERDYIAAYRLRRGANLVRVDNSGHMIMLDQPARFRAELAAFLRR